MAAAAAFGTATAGSAPTLKPQTVESESGSGKRNAASTSLQIWSLHTVSFDSMSASRCDGEPVTWKAAARTAIGSFVSSP
jgi:hypothetical protein